MSTQRMSKLVTIFIYSFICSILLILIPVLYFKNLKPVDQNFLDLLLPSARTAFLLPYRSNDSRNYLLGIFIIIFTILAYISIYVWSIHKKNNKKIYLNFFYSVILIVIVSYIGVILYIFYTVGWNETYNLLGLALKDIFSIKRYRYPIALLLFSYVAIYFGLRTKIVFTLHKLIKQIHFPTVTLSSIVMNIFMLLVISLLLFNPRYKYSYEKLLNYGEEAVHQFHHANFFIAPINEIMNGKMLLVNAQAQYGILLTYIPAIIFKLSNLSYGNFTLYTMIVSIIYVFLFYLFLFKITHHRLLSIVGTVGFIKLAFFRTFWPYEVYVLPSTTPIRYFFDIVSMFSVYLLYNKFSNKKLFFTSFIISLAFFYNIETGLSIILAYFGITCIYLLINLTKKSIWIRTIKIIISLIFFFLMAGFLISLATYFRIHELPDWISFFHYVFVYGKGAYDVPMPFIGSYYFVIFIYIATFYLLIYKFLTQDFTKFHITLFILFYGILSFFYYLIISEPHHFLTIVHPAIILSIILLDYVINSQRQLLKLPIHQIAIITTCSLFIIGYLFWAPLKTWKYILLRYNNRYAALPQPYYQWNYTGTNFSLTDNNGSDFITSADTITSLSGSEKSVVILSRYDTLLYVMTGKTSLTNHPIIEYNIGFIREIEQAVNTILSRKPYYVYVFSKPYNAMTNRNIHEIWDAVKTRYSFVKNAGVVDVYKLIKLSESSLD